MDINSLIFSDEYLLVLNPEFRIQKFSPYLRTHFQWDGHELLGQNVLRLIPERDHPHFRRQMSKLQAQHPLIEFEALVQNRQGEHRLFRWRAHLNNDQIHLLGRDFSLEKKQADELLKALDRLQLSLSNTGLGLWEHNFTTQELIWDERMYSLHGLKRDLLPDSQSLQAAIARIAVPEDAKVNWARIPDIIQRGADINMSYRVLWPDGRVRHLRTIGKRAQNTKDLVYFGNTWDATDEIQTEQTLKEQEAKMVASTKMAALGEMSGGIAHEINNPLTVIQARAFQLNQLADTGKLEPGKVKQAAESISKTADKIARIIKSLRSFARDGAGDPFDFFSVKQVVEETLEFCKTRFYNHGVEIEVDPIPEDLEFECRLIQIEQVLLNLLNNSFDAIQKLPEKWIRLSVEDLDDRIALHVTDSGHGLSDEVAEKMLQPFFTTKEVGKGTGLGLSISNGIIRGHHGELFYERGYPNTRMTILLPKFQNI